jgi:hypothetical protein
MRFGNRRNSLDRKCRCWVESVVLVNAFHGVGVGVWCLIFSLLPFFYDLACVREEFSVYVLIMI